MRRPAAHPGHAHPPYTPLELRPVLPLHTDLGCSNFSPFQTTTSFQHTKGRWHRPTSSRDPAPQSSPLLQPVDACRDLQPTSSAATSVISTPCGSCRTTPRPRRVSLFPLGSCNHALQVLQLSVDLIMHDECAVNAGSFVSETDNQAVPYHGCSHGH